MSTRLLGILAEQDPDVLSKLIDDAGPIAMAFVVAIGIALFVLFRSMSKQLKRIDPQLPAGHDDRAQAQDRQYTQEAVERGEASALDADEPPRA